MTDTNTMGTPQPNIDTIEVRLAQDEEEVRAAQNLRFKVFYEEWNAIPDEQMAREKRDIDRYDPVADHLIVIDHAKSNGQNYIVGTYRLLRQDIADQNGGFYTSNEYDISLLTQSGMPLLELGRSCVLPEYRTRPVLQLLWEGIADYMLDHEIGMLFGCGSLHGTDIEPISETLAYLYHHHLAPKEWCPRALEELHVNMDLHDMDSLNPKQIFSSLPALIKGYLRVGACIGNGAVIDKQFNTTDVCIVMPLSQVSSRYRKYYSRKINREIPEKSTNQKVIITAQES